MRLRSLSGGFLAVAALVLTGWGVQMLVRGASEPPGSERMAQLIAACAYLGGGLGLAFAALPMKRGSSAPSPGSLRIEVPLAALSAAVLGWLIWKFGMRQFGGFDHSALIDTGWRLAKGQHPYSDFPCSVPVGFYLGAKYALLLFGRFWRSFVILDIVFAIVTFLWSLWLLNKATADRLKAFSLAFTIQAASTVITSYWWYNPVTVIPAVLFFLSAWLLLEKPEDRVVRLSYAVSLLLLAAMKPNIAGLLIAGATLVLFSSRKHRLTVISLSAVALLVFIILLALEGLSLVAVVRSYLGVAGRGLTLIAHFGGFTGPERICTIALAFLFLAPASAPMQTWRMLRAGDRRPLLCILASLAGLYGFLTNGEVKLVDSPLLLVAGSFLPAACFGNLPQAATLRDWWLRYGRIVVFLILGTALGQAATRSRVWSIGPGSFFEFQRAKGAIPNAFFQGLHGGPRLQSTVREVGEVIGRHPGARVFFGPRMQWAYAAYGLESPKRQPIWWHPGVSYNATDESAYVQAWQDEHFDLAIFLKDDYTYLPSRMITLLQTEFYPDNSFPNLTVDLRKPATP